MLLHDGASKTLSLIAVDSNGSVVSFEGRTGEVAWSSDNAAANVAVSPTLGARASVTGQGIAGTAHISAQIGSITCVAATVVNFASPPANEFRVVVASQTDQSLINDATVVVNDSVQTSGSGGAYTFTGVTTPASVSVFYDGFTYVTLLGVTSTDVLVLLPAMVAPGKAAGQMTPMDFANLQSLAGTVHLAFTGASMPGNLYDNDLSLLLADPVLTNINLGGGMQTNVNLPAGLVVGLGQQMIKGDFEVRSAPGHRTVWGLGGNIILSDILGVVSGAEGSSNVDIGPILTALRPVIGRLQSGVIVDEQFTSGQTEPITIPYDTLMRLETTVSLPSLPTYASGGNQSRLDLALVLAGVTPPSQGFVPLGLSAGIDRNTGASMDGVPDGVIDPVQIGMTAYGPGQLALRLAPPHGGIEGSPYEGVALAMNSKALPGSTKPSFAMSARVTFPGDLLYKNNATNKLSFGSSFLDVPPEAVVDTGQRAVTGLSGSATGADFYRLELANGWQVYFPPSMTSVSVPLPPEGVDDRLITATSAGLRAVSLKLKTGVDYQSAAQFDSDNLDDLSGAMDAYSVRAVQIAVPTGN